MNKKITILVDNESWIDPYAKKLVDILKIKNYDAKLVNEHTLVQEGWINFMLGCVSLASSQTLLKNKYNLVVHESNLPDGKGHAPMAWQILDGKLRIPICLIEASNKADAGNIWLKDVIELNGDELHQEWRHKQGQKTIDLCINFVENYKDINPNPQAHLEGSVVYKKRTVKDSELDIDQSIKKQFNLLRVVDNEKYPAFFTHHGIKYFLKIYQQ